jgi:hypothetical protein
MSGVEVKTDSKSRAASKVLIYENLTISADRRSWWGLCLRCSTVGLSRIADYGLTAFLLVIAFRLPIAHRCRGAGLGPPVCRNPIAYYRLPLINLRSLSLIVPTPK